MDSSITRGSSPDDPDEEDDLGLLPNGNAEKNKYIDSVIEEALRGMLDKKRSNSSNVRTNNDLGSESGVKEECDTSSKSVSVDHNVHFLTDHQYGYVEATPEEIRHSNEISVNDDPFERSEDSDQGLEVLFTEEVLDDLNSRNDSVEELLSPDKCASVKILKEDRTFVKQTKNENSSKANPLKCYYESAVYNLVDDSRSDIQETSFLPSENNNLTDAQIPVLINENEVEIPPYDDDRPIPKLTPQIIVGVVPPSNHENNLNIDNQVSHVSEVPILSNNKQESYHIATLKHGSSKTVANSTILNGFTEKSEYTHKDVNMWPRISSGNNIKIPRKGIKHSSNEGYIIPLGRPINKKNIKNNTHNCSVFTVKTDNILVNEKKAGLCSPTNISTLPSMPILIEETQKLIKSNKGETSIKPNDKNMGRKQIPTRSTATPLRLFQRSVIKELSSSAVNNNKKPVNKHKKNAKPDKLLLSGITTNDITVYSEKQNLTNNKKTIGLGECENQSEINSNIEITDFLLRKNELNEEIRKNDIKEGLNKKQLNNVIEKNIYSSVLETDTFDLLSDLDPEKPQTNLNDESVHSLDPFIKANEPTADILEAMPVASILDEGLKSDLLEEGQVSTLEDGPLSILNFFDKDLNCSTESVEKNKLIDIIEEVGPKDNSKEVSYLISNLDKANYDKSKSEVLGNYSSLNNRLKISPFTSTAPELKEYDENNIISDIEKIDQIIDREIALSDAGSKNLSKNHDLKDSRSAGNVIENNSQLDSSDAKPELLQDRVNVSSEVIVDSFNNQLSGKLNENVSQPERNQIDRQHPIQQNNILGTDGKTIDASMSNKEQESNSSKCQDHSDYLEDISDGDFEIDDFEDSRSPTLNRFDDRNAPTDQKNNLSRSNIANSSKKCGNKKVPLQRKVTPFHNVPKIKFLKDSSSFNTSFSAHKNKNTYKNSGCRKKTRVPENRHNLNSRKPFQEGQKNLKPLQIKSMPIGKESPYSETSKNTSSVVNKKSVASEELNLIPNGRVSPSETIGVDPPCRRHKNLIINIEDNICKRMQQDKANFSNSKTNISLSQLEDSDLRNKLPDHNFPLSKSNIAKKNRNEDNVIVGSLTVTNEIKLSPTLNRKQVVMKSPQNNKRNEPKGKKASLEETVKKLMDSCVLKSGNRNTLSESENSDSILSCSNKIETEIIHDNLDAQLEMELSSGKYNSIFNQSKHIKFEDPKEKASSSAMKKYVLDLSVTADENLSESSKKEICSNVISLNVDGCSIHDMGVSKKKTGIEHKTTKQPIVTDTAVLTDELVTKSKQKSVAIDCRIDESHEVVPATTKENIVLNHINSDTNIEDKNSMKNLSGEIQKSIRSIDNEKILQKSLSKLEAPNDVEINKNISDVVIVNPQYISLTNNLSNSQTETSLKNLICSNIEPIIDFNNTTPLDRANKLELCKKTYVENSDSDYVTKTMKNKQDINDSENVSNVTYNPSCLENAPTDDENITILPEKSLANELSNIESIKDNKVGLNVTVPTNYYENITVTTNQTIVKDGNTVKLVTAIKDSETIDQIINVPVEIKSSNNTSCVSNEITEKLPSVECKNLTLTDNENSPNVPDKSYSDKSPNIESAGNGTSVMNAPETSDTAKQTSSKNKEIIEKAHSAGKIPTLSGNENGADITKISPRLETVSNCGNSTNIPEKINSENPPSVDDTLLEATKTTKEVSINNKSTEKSLTEEKIMLSHSDNENSTKMYPEKQLSIENVGDKTNVINVSDETATTKEGSFLNNEITEKSPNVIKTNSENPLSIESVNDDTNGNSVNVVEKVNHEKHPGIESVGGDTNVINVTEATETSKKTCVSKRIAEKQHCFEHIQSHSDYENSTDKSYPVKALSIESVGDDTNVISCVPAVTDNANQTSSVYKNISEKSHSVESISPNLIDNGNSTMITEILSPRLENISDCKIVTNITEKTNSENPQSTESVGNDTNLTNVPDAIKPSKEISMINEITKKSRGVEITMLILSYNENSTSVTEKMYPEKQASEEQASIENVSNDTNLMFTNATETTRETSSLNIEISEKSPNNPTLSGTENMTEKPSCVDNLGGDTDVINVTECSKEISSRNSEITEKNHNVGTIIPTRSNNENNTNVTEKSYPEKLLSEEILGDDINVIDATETMRTGEEDSSVNNKGTKKTLGTVSESENGSNNTEKTNPEMPPNHESVGHDTNVINVTKATETNNEPTKKSHSVKSICPNLRENEKSIVTEISSPRLETVTDSGNITITKKTESENLLSIESVNDDTNLINVPEATETNTETTSCNNEIAEKSHSVESISPIFRENGSTYITEKSYPEKLLGTESLGDDTNSTKTSGTTEEGCSLNNNSTEKTRTSETLSDSGNGSNIIEKTNPEIPPSIESFGDDTNVINVTKATETNYEIAKKSNCVKICSPNFKKTENSTVTEMSSSRLETVSDSGKVTITNKTNSENPLSIDSVNDETNGNSINVVEKANHEKYPGIESVGGDTNVIHVTEATETSKETCVSKGIAEKQHCFEHIQTHSDYENSTDKSYPVKALSIESVGDDTNVISCVPAVTDNANQTSSVYKNITEKSQSVESISPNLIENGNSTVTEISPRLETVSESGNITITKKTISENPLSVNDGTNLINVLEATKNTTETYIDNEITKKSHSVENSLTLRENESTTVTKKSYSEKLPSTESIGDDTNSTKTIGTAEEGSSVNNKGTRKTLGTVSESENGSNNTKKMNPEIPPNQESVGPDTNVINVTKATETNNETTEKSHSVKSICPNLREYENSTVTEMSSPRLETVTDSGNITITKKTISENPLSVNDGTNLINVLEATEINTETTSFNNEIAEKSHSVESIRPIFRENGIPFIIEKSYPEKLLGTESLGDDINSTKTIKTTEEDSSVNNKSTEKTQTLETVSNYGNGSNIIEKTNPGIPPSIESVGDDTNVINVTKATETNNEIAKKSHCVKICSQHSVESISPNLIENGNSTVTEMSSSRLETVTDSGNVTIIEKTNSENPLSIESVNDDTNLINVPEATKTNTETSSINNEITEKSRSEENISLPLTENESTNVTEKSYLEKLLSTESLGDGTNSTKTIGTTEEDSSVNNNSTEKTRTSETLSDSGNGSKIIEKTNPEIPPSIESFGDDTNVINVSKATETNNEVAIKSNCVKFCSPNLRENENTINAENNDKLLSLGRTSQIVSDNISTPEISGQLSGLENVNRTVIDDEKDINVTEKISTSADKPQFMRSQKNINIKRNHVFNEGNSIGHLSKRTSNTKNEPAATLFNHPFSSVLSDQQTDNISSGHSSTDNKVKDNDISENNETKSTSLRLAKNCVNSTISNPVHSKTVQELTKKCILKEVKILVEKINFVNTSSKINCEKNVESSDHTVHKRKRQILGHNESVKRSSNTSMVKEEPPTKILLLKSPKLVDPHFLDKNKKTEGGINLRRKTTILRKEETEDNTHGNLVPLLLKLDSLRRIYECMDENNVKKAFIPSNICNLLKKDTCPPSKYSHLEIISTKSTERNSRFKRRRRKSPLSGTDDESDNKNSSSTRRLGRPRRSNKRARHNKGPISIENHSNFNEPSFPYTNNETSTRANGQSESLSIHERTVTSSTNLSTAKILCQSEISNEAVPKHLNVGGSIKETLLNVVRERLNQAAGPPEDEEDSDDDFMGFEHELPCGCSIQSNTINQSCAVNCFIRRSNFKLCYLNRTIKLSSKHFSSKRNERYRTFRPLRQETGKEDHVRGNKSIQLHDEDSTSVKPFRDPGICFMSLGIISLKNEQSFNPEGSNYSGLDSSNNVKVPDNKRTRRIARLGTKLSSVTETDKNNEEDSDSSS